MNEKASHSCSVLALITKKKEIKYFGLFCALE